MLTSTGFRLVLLLAGLTLGACSGTATPPPSAPNSTAGAPSAAATASLSPGNPTAAASAGGPSAVAGKGTITGTIVTSGVYSANWTVFVGNNSASPFGRFGLTSDKGSAPGAGPEANLQVSNDGRIEFGGINGGRDGNVPADFGQGGPYAGGGGQTVVRTDANGNDYVCGVTVDSDLTGPTGVILHVKGTLTISGAFLTTLGVTIDC